MTKLKPQNHELKTQNMAVNDSIRVKIIVDEVSEDSNEAFKGLFGWFWSIIWLIIVKGQYYILLNWSYFFGQCLAFNQSTHYNLIHGSTIEETIHQLGWKLDRPRGRSHSKVRIWEGPREWTHDVGQPFVDPHWPLWKVLSWALV